MVFTKKSLIIRQIQEPNCSPLSWFFYSYSTQLKGYVAVVRKSKTYRTRRIHQCSLAARKQKLAQVSAQFTRHFLRSGYGYVNRTGTQICYSYVSQKYLTFSQSFCIGQGVVITNLQENSIKPGDEKNSSFTIQWVELGSKLGVFAPSPQGRNQWACTWCTCTTH